MISKAAGICLLITILIITACTNAEAPTPSQVKVAEEVSPTAAVIKSNMNACQFTLDKDLLDTGEKGQLKGLNVNLSSSKSELKEAYREPDEIGFENVEYLKYDNCFFYIWDQDKIGVIDILVNFSVEQVKEILGTPDFEGISDAGYDEYGLSYQTGEYYLYFSYENKESTEGVFRIKGV